MAAYDFKPNLPPGLFNGIVFFGVVVFGSGYIIFSKLHDFGALAATAVPVLVMIGYAVLLGARLFRLRDGGVQRRFDRRCRRWRLRRR